jgi:hypothetical protein
MRRIGLMSILSTSKILICINSCERDIDSILKLKESEWYKDCKARDNITIVFYYADPSLGQDDFVHKPSSFELKLNTEESYDNLSIKTFKMLSSCSTIFDFDFLLKVDCKIIDDQHNSTSSLFSFENFNKCFYDESMFKDYGGFTPIVGSTVESFRNWASSKKLFVLPEIFISNHNLDGLPNHYWAGGGYCLSKIYVNRIIEQENLFRECKNLMGGCEDICVGIACNYETN